MELAQSFLNQGESSSETEDKGVERFAEVCAEINLNIVIWSGRKR